MLGTALLSSPMLILHVCVTQNNQGQAGGPRGLDINVVPAWQQGFSGRGVSVCVLDDGIEHTHDDLKDNYVSLSCCTITIAVGQLRSA